MLQSQPAVHDDAIEPRRTLDDAAFKHVSVFNVANIAELNVLEPIKSSQHSTPQDSSNTGTPRS
jgi:hypothetical protein